MEKLPLDNVFRCLILLLAKSKEQKVVAQGGAVWERGRRTGRGGGRERVERRGREVGDQPFGFLINSVWPSLSLF